MIIHTDSYIIGKVGCNKSAFFFEERGITLKTTYKDRIIVITGASGGIGAEVACLAAERGAIPILLARRADKLAEVGSRIAGDKGLYTVDVTNDEQVTAAVEQIMEKYGRIDIWINNAGFGLFENVLDMSMDRFEELMNVNYYAVVRCTKTVLPHMLRAKQGHIINVASVAGKIGTPKGAGYSASKHAVLGFTNSIRGELAGTGVRISSLNPTSGHSLLRDLRSAWTLSKEYSAVYDRCEYGCTSYVASH